MFALKKLLKRLSLVALFFLSPIFAYASPRLSACLVTDYKTGAVLYTKNSHDRVHPASLTKMMTLYIAFQELDSGHLSLYKQFRVSRHAAGRAPSKLGLKPGQMVNVRDLILGMVTRSANDASTTLAEGIGGNEANFVKQMNQQARLLGMKNTVFYNADGLPNAKQYTTATDMSILGTALLRDHPNDYRYFATRDFWFNGNLFKSHNHFLDLYPGADGIKTGYVNASGYNLVASATRNNRRLVGVIFGDPSAKYRDRHMAKLLDQCFQS